MAIDKNMQKAFIAMLFAFVVAEVGQKMASIFSVLTSRWLAPDGLSGIGEALFMGDGAVLAALAQSCLALLMISMSWVMWSKSQAAAHVNDVSDVFSAKFLTVLLEVILVIMYFTLVESVESVSENNGEISSGVASARPEALQIMCVFSLFVFWDYFVDVYQSPLSGGRFGHFGRLLSSMRGALTYCSASLLCFLLAWLVLHFTPIDETGFQAALGDAGLIVIVLIFYKIKVIEYYMIRLFPAEGARNATKRPAPPGQKDVFIIFALFAVFVVILILRCGLPCILK